MQNKTLGVNLNCGLIVFFFPFFFTQQFVSKFNNIWILRPKNFQKIQIYLYFMWTEINFFLQFAKFIALHKQTVFFLHAKLLEKLTDWSRPQLNSSAYRLSIVPLLIAFPCNALNNYNVVLLSHNIFRMSHRTRILSQTSWPCTGPSRGLSAARNLTWGNFVVKAEEYCTKPYDPKPYSPKPYKAGRRRDPGAEAALVRPVSQRAAGELGLRFGFRGLGLWGWVRVGGVRVWGIRVESLLRDCRSRA